LPDATGIHGIRGFGLDVLIHPVPPWLGYLTSPSQLPISNANTRFQSVFMLMTNRKLETRHRHPNPKFEPRNPKQFRNSKTAIVETVQGGPNPKLEYRNSKTAML
jgi:hypothetical protein